MGKAVKSGLMARLEGGSPMTASNRGTFEDVLGDISILAGVNDLEWLYLRGSEVSDISALSGQSGLRKLCLDKTFVSGDGVESLKAALPKLNVEWKG